MKFVALVASITLGLGAMGASLVQAESTITQDEWSAYQAAFIGDDGRVIDTGNGGISHSEGQGYGMVLSVLADDQATFERVWAFTQSELMVRGDGLAAWRWEPDQTPHITDDNNATDGDILIAYGLALAGKAWGDGDKTNAAKAMIETIGDTMLEPFEEMDVIRPAAEGFSAKDRPEDGPVINPSYWVFEAFPVFAELDPAIDWVGVGSDGLELMQKARIAPAMLPSEWVSLKDGTIRPADGFPPEFGYNSIRIPVYLMRADADVRYLKPYAAIGTGEGVDRIEVTSGTALETLKEPGYRLIQAAINCTLQGMPIPQDLQTMTPSTYYAATLQLLLLDHLRRKQTQCLGHVGQ